MPEQLQTIITALLAGATSSAVVLFAAKKLLESLIDSRIRRADSAYAADFAEHMRRRAALFDAQADAVDELTATAYRIRNSARDLLPEDRLESIDNVEKNLRALSDQFAIELTRRRSILPSLLFETIHEIRSPLRCLLLDLDRLKAATPDERKQVLESAKTEARHISIIYESFVELAQAHRGVDRDPK